MHAKDPPVNAEISLHSDVAALLGARIGFDAETLGPSFLEAVVERAVRESGAEDERSWWQAVEGGGPLWQQLVDLVVVSETWMFRDPAACEHLGRVLVQRRERVGRRPLRILSCPCSTGEEPYTVAITLLQAGLSPEDFAIDAVDVSARAVAQAEQGRIGRHSFRGGATPQPGFFEPDAGTSSWVVSPHARGSIRFKVGNLVSGDGLPRTDGFDLILCRNLLIYLLPQARVAVLERLAGMLRPDGLLIVGNVEAGVLVQAGFRIEGRPDWFSFHLPGPVRPLPPPPTTPASARATTERPAAVAYGGALQVRVDSMPPRRSASSQPSRLSLEQIRARADAGDTQAALTECRRYLDESPQSVAAYLLFAALHAASGDLAATQGSLRRALYVDPDCVEALMHLAAILSDRGDGSAANRLRARVARLAAAVEDSQS